MYKGLLLLLILGVLTHAQHEDDICLPPKDMSPCTCDGEGINCMEVKNVKDIERIFSKRFPQSGVKAVWIQGTPIKVIPSNLFGVNFAQNFFIEQNEIETVHMSAFKASKKTLVTLSFFNNRIADFPYSSLGEYDILGTLNLGKNMIRSIPDNAFNHESLSTIILAHNQITHIGAHAFANLKYLSRLDFTLNPLSKLGPLSMAMNKHLPYLTINFANNNISDVSSSAFEGTLPQEVIFTNNKFTSLKEKSFELFVTKLAKKEATIELTGNPFTCQGCDYSWMVRNKESIASTVVGFACTNGNELQDLTNSNIGCD